MQQELARRAREGDHDAFSALVRETLGRLYTTARLILRDPDRAEDAVQDALIDAWRDIRGLRDLDRLDAWLHKLLVRSCYRAAKRERRRTISEIPLGPFHDGARPDGSLSVADRDEIERAFQRLTQDQRTVLTLVYFADLSLADAAVALGVPIGTTKSRLHHALQRAPRCHGRRRASPRAQGRCRMNATDRAMPNDDLERRLRSWMGEQGPDADLTSAYDAIVDATRARGAAPVVPRPTRRSGARCRSASGGSSPSGWRWPRSSCCWSRSRSPRASSSESRLAADPTLPLPPLPPALSIDDQARPAGRHDLHEPRVRPADDLPGHPADPRRPVHGRRLPLPVDEPAIHGVRASEGLRRGAPDHPTLGGRLRRPSVTTRTQMRSPPRSSPFRRRAARPISATSARARPSRRACSPARYEGRVVEMLGYAPLFAGDVDDRDRLPAAAGARQRRSRDRDPPGPERAVRPGRPRRRARRHPGQHGGLRRGERVRSALERLCPGGRDGAPACPRPDHRHPVRSASRIARSSLPPYDGRADEMITRRTMALLVALVVAGCDSSAPPVQSSSPPASARIPACHRERHDTRPSRASSPSIPAEVEIGEPVSIRLSGFPPNREVTVRATTVGLAYPDLEDTGTIRESEATFQTDAQRRCRPGNAGTRQRVVCHRQCHGPVLVDEGRRRASRTRRRHPRRRTRPIRGPSVQYRTQLTAEVDGAPVATAIVDQDLGSPDVTMTRDLGRWPARPVLPASRSGAVPRRDRPVRQQRWRDPETTEGVRRRGLRRPVAAVLQLHVADRWHGAAVDDRRAPAGVLRQGDRLAAGPAGASTPTGSGSTARRSAVRWRCSSARGTRRSRA